MCRAGCRRRRRSGRWRSRGQGHDHRLLPGQLQAVAGAQRDGAGHPDAVDEGAVGAAGVLHETAVRQAVDDGVPAGHGRGGGKRQAVFGPAADGDPPRQRDGPAGGGSFLEAQGQDRRRVGRRRRCDCGGVNGGGRLAFLGGGTAAGSAGSRAGSGWRGADAAGCRAPQPMQKALPALSRAPHPAQKTDPWSMRLLQEECSKLRRITCHSTRCRTRKSSRAARGKLPGSAGRTAPAVARPPPRDDCRCGRGLFSME